MHQRNSTQPQSFIIIRENYNFSKLAALKKHQWCGRQRAPQTNDQYVPLIERVCLQGNRKIDGTYILFLNKTARRSRCNGLSAPALGIPGQTQNAMQLAIHHMTSVAARLPNRHGQLGPVANAQSVSSVPYVTM
jgi:hypothetical protein